MVYSNGEIQKAIYSDNYLASWSIRCSSPDCLSCKKSGSIKKNASGTIEFGSEYACYREYRTYSIGKVSNQSNEFELILNDNGDQYDPDKFMYIDRMKIYKIDSYSGREEEIFGAGGLDMLSGVNRLKFHLYSQDMHKNFKIQFYSSKCQHYEEHYYFVNYYYSNFGAELSNSSLTLVKHH